MTNVGVTVWFVYCDKVELFYYCEKLIDIMHALCLIILSSLSSMFVRVRLGAALVVGRPPSWAG